ncbi:MAG: hypothetical protein RR853_02055 [Aurantimicrobium sp.]|uniref:hypothetical protein n=1 Tax=Aurantimicrobium sp. TaxID=1930784 RepID=UPI002FC7B037
MADLSEVAWSRKILLEKFNLSDENLKTGQIQAGILFLVKNDQNIKLVSDWLQFCKLEKYKYLVDGPPQEINFPNFVEHRHDQAIFSGLAKSISFPTIIDETFWQPNWETEGKDFPIWAMRSKTGINPDGPNVYDLIDRIYSAVQHNTFALQLWKFTKKLLKKTN